MKQFLLILVTLGGLAGCNQKVKEENGNLIARIDSLQLALDQNTYMASMLEQIGVYLDSIDNNRNWINVNLETGINQEDYVDRMKAINQYVQKAENTILELEKTKSSFISQIKRLKDELMAKNNEIQTLQIGIAKYAEENLQLQEKLTISEGELISNEIDLDMAREDLTLAKTDVDNLLKKVQLTEAEVLYAQGEGLEEVARHIQLAPKRKKQTLEKALDYYSASYDKGHEPAKTKIDELKGKLKLTI